MDAIDRTVYGACTLLIIGGLAFIGLGAALRTKEAHSGPQCTLVYPRGFELSKGPDDGPACGDIAQSWRACASRFSI